MTMKDESLFTVIDGAGNAAFETNDIKLARTVIENKPNWFIQYSQAAIDFLYNNDGKDLEAGDIVIVINTVSTGHSVDLVLEGPARLIERAHAHTDEVSEIWRVEFFDGNFIRRIFPADHVRKSFNFEQQRLETRAFGKHTVTGEGES